MTGQEVYLYVIAPKYRDQNPENAAFLDTGHRHTVKRASENPLRLEMEVWFDARQSADALYEIEDELCRLCEAASFRLFPHYPPSAFTPSAMEEIFTEAGKIGAVANGFFYEAKCYDTGEVIEVEIPFLQGGLSMLARTETILSNILNHRYGIRRKVSIKASEDAADRARKRDEAIAAADLSRQREAAEREEARRQAEKRREAEEAMRAAAASKPDERMFGQDAPVEQIGTDVKIGAFYYDLNEPKWLLGDGASLDKVSTIAGALGQGGGTVTVVGRVFSVELRENRQGDRLTLLLCLGDGTGAVYLRRSFSVEEAAWAKGIKPDMILVARGRMYREKFFNDEWVCSPNHVALIKRHTRPDNAPKKRVELHLHTNMSSMDAMIRPKELVETARFFGHTAVGITDHGNVQSFPEMMKNSAVKDGGSAPKILYGMEAYFVNDTGRALYGENDFRLSDEVVVFDLETTGLSAVTCKITEIGAVKIKGGQITDRFGTFVNPGVPIPPRITEITGITDEMVKDAPKIEEILQSFLDFIGDKLLIAHNANFDIGFVRAAAEACELPFENTYLDTVALSRFLNPKLPKHTLDSLAEFYSLGDFNHHRAVDDAAMLAEIFFKMQAQLEGDGITTFTGMQSVMREKVDPSKIKPYHMVIYAKDHVGLKNLYKLVSESYLTYFHRRPRIPKTLLDKHREGLILGSACVEGELLSAIMENRSESDIEEIVRYYDYLEIQPICNNRFLIANGTMANDEALRDLNRRVVRLGERYDKPVVATCDAHFLHKEDEIYRKILMAGMKFSDADRDVGLYYRTTEEMLEEFSYLGEKKAYELVVENTNLIADMIEEILPIPEGSYPPSIEGAEEDLKRLCYERAHDWYGDPLPEIVEARLDKELTSIIKNGFAVLYMIAQKLVKYSEDQGYLVGSRGSVGSSIVASMAGISEVNPLPPHYRCPSCRFSEFITDGSVGSGFDMDDKNCPRCGTPMITDGHDIPFETFLGFKGEKSPDIDLNFSGEVQGRVHKYTEELFGEGKVYRAGTTSTLADKTAYGYVMKYLEERGIHMSRAEIDAVVLSCVGVKRTTGQHPGGIIVVPQDKDIYDFTPIQHPADDPNSDIVTTHFQFSYLHDTILKLDELGHDIPTKYKMLERYTDTSVMDVKMNDKAVYELFHSPAPLGLTAEAIGCPVGTLGLPEMGTRFIQQVLVDASPKNFADLVQISGLTHGTNVWLGNAQDLIKEGICDISQVVGTRDGIMLTLIRYGLDNADAFNIMEKVRKGKGLTAEQEELMRSHGVPDWYITSCKKIKYMFPKAHAAAYVMSAIRLGWYKIYYKTAFYAAYLTAAPDDFDGVVVGGGLASINKTMKEIEEKGKEATQKEIDLATLLYLVREAVLRGIKFLPVNLEKSDAFAFIPEGDDIRMPFLALPGLGRVAAKSIAAVRDEGVYSVQELQEKTGISKSVLDLLRKNGVLAGLQETDQISFF